MVSFRGSSISNLAQNVEYLPYLVPTPPHPVPAKVPYNRHPIHALSASGRRRRLARRGNLGNLLQLSLLLRMTDNKSKAALGFLTVISDAENGLFGGYLVLNQAGRPLEFHCTAPVKPNRAQEILYGPTLEPYLFGEQIGQTLVRKATHNVLVVCTDRPPVLAVRDFLTIPVALVLSPESEREGPPNPWQAGPSATFRWDPPHQRYRLVTFKLGQNWLAVPSHVQRDQAAIAERLEEIIEGFDLLEPFQRIREAIDEARRGGAAG